MTYFVSSLLLLRIHTNTLGIRDDLGVIPFFHVMSFCSSVECLYPFSVSDDMIMWPSVLYSWMGGSQWTGPHRHWSNLWSYDLGRSHDLPMSQSTFVQMPVQVSGHFEPSCSSRCPQALSCPPPGLHTHTVFKVALYCIFKHSFMDPKGPIETERCDTCFN